jgi:hypothetical protein
MMEHKPKQSTTALSQSKSLSHRNSLKREIPKNAKVLPIPSGYAIVLGELKRRITEERLRTVFAANAAMILLYWDIGKTILERQEHEGWGTKVIDRLSADLRRAFPAITVLTQRRKNGTNCYRQKLSGWKKTVRGSNAF